MSSIYCALTADDPISKVNTDTFKLILVVHSIKTRSLPMVIHRSVYRLSAIITVAVLLAACGGEPAPAAQAPVATEIPVAIQDRGSG